MITAAFGFCTKSLFAILVLSPVLEMRRQAQRGEVIRFALQRGGLSCILT